MEYKITHNPDMALRERLRIADEEARRNHGGNYEALMCSIRQYSFRAPFPGYIPKSKIKMRRKNVQDS